MLASIPRIEAPQRHNLSELLRLSESVLEVMAALTFVEDRGSAVYGTKCKTDKMMLTIEGRSVMLLTKYPILVIMISDL